MTIISSILKCKSKLHVSNNFTKSIFLIFKKKFYVILFLYEYFFYKLCKSDNFNSDLIKKIYDINYYLRNI